MISVNDILKELKEACKAVCTTVDLQERASATNEGRNVFCVVSLPVSINDRVCGYHYDWFAKTGVEFEIYVKDRATASNPNSPNVPTMDELVNQMMSMFPMVFPDCDTPFRVVRPEIIYWGRTDYNGFHSTLIQAILDTLV